MNKFTKMILLFILLLPACILPAMAQGDTTYDNGEYGKTITFGRYEQDNDMSNGPEAIEWQVLAVEDGRALVISRYGLDAKPYNEEEIDATWETSTLRAWLNGTFYDSAFDSKEKERIREVTVKNPDNIDFWTKGGNDTRDRIFLLSIDEAEQYFKNDDARKCQATAYAKANGAYVNDVNCNSSWWLRSPGYISVYIARVDSDGFVGTDGGFVRDPAAVIRAAFWLDLSDSQEIAISTPTEIPEPKADAGDIITFGRYEQDNNTSNGPEAIEWQVLAVEDGRALVISRYGLDMKPFNEKRAAVTWETSTLRAWLNGTFYDSAFDSKEKERIREVTVKNPDNPEYGTAGGNDTRDCIFLLSIDEANKYFKDEDARMYQATAYAKANGAYVNNGNASWWLRSPGDSSIDAAYVFFVGFAYTLGRIVDGTDIVARAAFWLDM